MDNPLHICVFGSADPEEGSAEYRQAYQVGRLIGQRGGVVINGGYGGTMTASAKGCKEAGGRTIGVTCGLWKSVANDWIDEIFGTDTLQERLNRLIELGTGGFIVLPGATGTLLELAMIWELMGKGFLPPRPILCLGAFWRPLVDMMKQARPKCGQFVQVVEKPEDIIDGLSAGAIQSS